MNMDPRYLEAMMHGEFNPKKKESKASKSRLDIELEKEVDNYVDQLDLNENTGDNKLQSSQAKREKMRLEIKEALKLPELSRNLDLAMDVLFSQGANYLSQEAYQTLLADFLNSTQLLAGMKLTDSADAYLQDLGKFTAETMSSVAAIAVAKYTEEKYEECLSLFSLLTVLNPGYSEYWFRLGIAAQKSANYDLATRAYTGAVEIDPEMIEARLFAAECYVAQKKLDEARNEIAEAKKISKQKQVDKTWLDLIPVVEETIK